MTKLCLLCGSNSSFSFFKFDQVSVAPNAPLKQENIKNDILGKLEIAVCNNCGHIFNKAYDEALVSSIYEEGYSSGLPNTPEIRSHYKKIIENVIGSERVNNKNIIEIGASDFTFAKMLAKSAAKVKSFEPSNLFFDIELKDYPNIERIPEYFSLSQLKDEKGFDLVVIRHVLEHVISPISIIKDIVTVLKIGGYLYLECPNVLDILSKKRYYDFFYEHVHYYNPDILESLLKMAGFEKIYFASLRDNQHFGILLKKTSEQDLNNIRAQANLEYISKIKNKIIEFKEQFNNYIEDLTRLINAEKSKGHNIAIWGAGCHGVTLACHLKLNEKIIDCFIDLNKLKDGHYASLSHIPIKTPEHVDFNKLSTIIIVASLHQEDIFKNLVNEYKFSKRVIGTYPNISVLREEGKNNFKKKDFLSIVIPCYNEKENLEILLNRLNEVIDKDCMELIIVDNGSSDGTWGYLEMIRDRYKYLKLVKIKENIGYGNGIIQGINHASGGVLAWTHADLQSDPEDVVRAYNLYEKISKTEPKVLVKGYRKKRNLLKKFFSLGMQFLSSVALGTYFSEINAQPKLFPRALLNNLKDAPNDFSFELYVLYVAKKEGYKIVSLPVDIKKRLYGKAKGGEGSDFKTRLRLMQRTFKYIFELRSKVKNDRMC